LGMALDEPQENDEVFNEKGIKFIIEKTLFQEVQPIDVEFVESAMGAGFMIKSELSKNAGCGSSCSC
jgi:iron-sulfur cluster assembly protein